MKYVIKREGVFEDYILMVADVVNFVDHDVEWDVSQVDVPKDATKFTFISEAAYAMEVLGLDVEEWGIIPLES
ncbi:hypothetical protein VPBG_00229 [Vibrio phage helene 12B3]|uniref:hypothetical protein n=1 Tax=Vibrio phage helene 12B3 TaxID=573173 RepID=UPI0002C04EF6|nr:hypothetical protein VPBG_00229 [Vibrio phage helene 12B3]YP_009223098.1 hypothetical protein VPLG_00249 [Vibrio phage eugene 12A10]AGG58001.1 hypothetical protein VPBG_00229 [Vibrio phage helene 12B3]AGN51688.1 hypothetical protein VPLG_00249 [Vibrio phage eugene 12A10]